VTVDPRARPSIVRAVAPDGSARDAFLDWEKALDDAGRLRSCVACGCPRLYRRRTLPRFAPFALVLAAAGVSERLLPQRRFAQLSVRYRRGADDTPASFAALLAAHGIRHLDASQRLDGDIYEIRATIGGTTADKEDLLTRSLRSNPDVIGFDLDKG